MQNSISQWFEQSSNVSLLRNAAWILGSGVFVRTSKSQMTTESMSNALTLAANWETLGFQSTGQLLDAMSRVDLRQVTELDKFYTHRIRESVGAHRKYEPMYPNFPKQVMNASDTELFLNAVMHYTGDLFGVRILPLYEKEERKALKSKDVQWKVLPFVSVQKLSELYKNALSMTTAWSPAMREIVYKITKEMSALVDVSEYMEINVPNKENLAVFASALHVCGANPSIVENKVTSVTDFVRMAIAFKDPLAGDVALCGEVSSKMGSFKRAWRRMALAYINEHSDFEQIVENMMQRRMLFVSLGEKLHPSEYASRFKNAEQAFFYVRNPKQLRMVSYMSKLEKFFRQKKMSNALELLKTRPGVFSRRIIAMLSMANANVKKDILTEFEHASCNIATNLLFNLRSFVERGLERTHRSYIPKGSISKVYVRENAKHTLSDEDRLMLLSIIENAISVKISALPSLGKVYVNPEVRGMLAPYGLRNASQDVRTMIRGSRLKLDEGSNIVRLFMWWKQASDRVDLDLSMVLLDEDFNVTQQCSWTQLRTDAMYHSGDITSAPNGACEFIDLDLTKVMKQDAKSAYAVMVVNAFTSTKFKDLPEAFAGYMLRSKMGKSGEIFDARTVMQKFDLVADGRVAVPMMVDLRNREAIWMDLGVKSYPNFASYRSYRVENQVNYITSAVKAMAYISKPTIGEILDSHIQYRPDTVLVENKEDADFVFDWDGNVTPFEHATISSQFVGD